MRQSIRHSITVSEKIPSALFQLLSKCPVEFSRSESLECDLLLPKRRRSLAVWFVRPEQMLFSLNRSDLETSIDRMESESITRIVIFLCLDVDSREFFNMLSAEFIVSLPQTMVVSDAQDFVETVTALVHFNPDAHDAKILSQFEAAANYFFDPTETVTNALMSIDGVRAVDIAFLLDSLGSLRAITASTASQMMERSPCDRRTAELLEAFFHTPLTALPVAEPDH